MNTTNKNHNGNGKRRWVIGGVAVAALALVLWAAYRPRPLDVELAAVSEGRVALVNVVTDWRARATTAAFTRYVT